MDQHTGCENLLSDCSFCSLSGAIQKEKKKKRMGGGKMFISIESIYNKFTPSHAELLARWRVSDPTARLFIYLIYKWNS